jgi:hypothetical protein
MAIQSLPWSFKTASPVRGCGIDAERISRFSSILASDRRPMPFVFSAQEIAFARAQQNPAESLCASFCCKEAFAKAIGRWYDFSQCRAYWQGTTGEFPLALGTGASAGIPAVRARAHVRRCGRSMLLACVFVIRKGKCHD